jgi:hypothetical protein
MPRVRPKLVTSSCRCGCRPLRFPTVRSTAGDEVCRLLGSASLLPARASSHLTRWEPRLVPRGTWPAGPAEPKRAKRFCLVACRGRGLLWRDAPTRTVQRVNSNHRPECGSARSVAASARWAHPSVACARSGLREVGCSYHAGASDGHGGSCEARVVFHLEPDPAVWNRAPHRRDVVLARGGAAVIVGMIGWITLAVVPRGTPRGDFLFAPRNLVGSTAGAADAARRGLRNASCAPSDPTGRSQTALSPRRRARRSTWNVPQPKGALTERLGLGAWGALAALVGEVPCR